VKYSTESFDCVVASDQLQIEESGTDVIAFDSKNQSFHLLNATVHSIIKLCNGSNTVKDIVTAIAREFPGADLKSVEEDVNEAIDTLRKIGLVSLIVHSAEPELVGSLGFAADSSLFALSLAGNSMFPVLLPTDKVLVKKCAFDELGKGDVIVWSDSGKFVAHRVLSTSTDVGEPFIITKGDFCTEPDPPVEASQIVGKVIAILRANALQWMRTLDTGSKNLLDKSNSSEAEGMADQVDLREPSYVRMQVLDLRDISRESIRNIGSVEQISLVLLSPQNADVWPEVRATNVKSVVTVPEDYRVFTGQPEMVPEIAAFLSAPLNLVVCGQIFLTAFTPEQIRATFKNLVLKGQAYVSSQDAKAALEAVTTIVTGSVCLAPHEHVRWMGASILGPEYSMTNRDKPLIAIGDLTPSPRLESVPKNVAQFNNLEVPVKEQTAAR
jgi:signal peptidase I